MRTLRLSEAGRVILFDSPYLFCALLCTDSSGLCECINKGCWVSFGSGSWTITLIQQLGPHPIIPTPPGSGNSVPSPRRENPSGRKVTTPPAVSPWGLHHPSLVTLAFPSLGLVGQGGGISLLNSIVQFVQFFEGTISFWLRQKLNSLLELAQLNMLKLGLGILAV